MNQQRQGNRQKRFPVILIDNFLYFVDCKAHTEYGQQACGRQPF